MRSIIIISICYLCITNLHVSAQQKQIEKFPVTKGYYSIYKNYEKLNNKKEISQKNITVPFVTKGYYTINNKNKRIGNKQPGYLHHPFSKPKAIKGYYAIYPDSLQTKQ